MIVIPARYASTRVPNKLLIDINGKSVIQRVWETCIRVPKEKVVIATDHFDIVEECERIGADYLMTGECENGTERVSQVAHAYDLKNSEWIINVQGDKVGVTEHAIETLKESFYKHDSYHTLFCMHEPLLEEREGIVKVLVNKNEEAVYFTRKLIPNARKHSGIYGYTVAFLKRYISWGKGEWEKSEGLEQMRVLENGCICRCIEYPFNSGLSINTHEDVEIARTQMQKKWERRLQVG